METGTMPRGGTALTRLGMGGKLADPAFRFDGSDTPMKLAGAQKAAVIVQMIVDAGGKIPLSVMSEATQVHLARVYASMGPINKATVSSVLDEFATHLEAHGLSFPVDTAAALEALQGHLSDDLLERMKQVHNPSLPKNTWETIADLPAEDLAERLKTESPRVGAIILSKLPSARASEVLELLDQDTANAVTYAISETEAVRSETVDVIAQTMLGGDAGDAGSGTVFSTGAAARAAELLNAAGSAQRDQVLAALDTLDEAFAAQVRKAIFTFADITSRVAPTDLPNVVRVLPGEELTAALKAGEAEHGEVVEFILENLSKRMADQMREELAEAPDLKGKPAEAAMGKLTAAIRDLVDKGEMTLITPDDTDDT
ncbi:flagellar motor switch protein FliG [Litoreibacter ponti]|uniref:Flagellar motor switch protein FliG n=1 Tax=Litoreibacter ponti TaxID=1510457 RepID=A0A2T6BKC5_9RHOB|nr:FliG C-terminal domain-containing protein [Litoreibacter ponti]PTX56508.1 flagellar motor switch protein FliG [Litoreibacter ponti]